ncbi:MAG: hypothetical protein F6J90_08175 [Moorea sp. SIOASIH]|uniref:hypothetical protein n=1 Tax=Moorena sp. SIOASIH TaxID=2607817 RepID=UPI0013B971DA|nr:hypothetical protein [Moorena sp. SIOASIH]NEO36297.1 hypothetical protein [Moorena sp. SIOASIH]
MTRWVESASWWNGHLGGTGILVERASWWNGHLGGTGILVERASWWNGHLARFLPQPMQHLQKLHQGSERDAPVENFESMDDFT